VPVKTLAQIETQELPQHLHKALVRRLVEAVQLFDLGNALVV
jgi:hypothetical protein